tara:strand:- start:40 stop:393 length:354 start_codon:yes stop_codon:yes gene_type:complete
MKNAIFNNTVTAAALSVAVLLSSQAGAAETQGQTLPSRHIETQSINIAYQGSDLASDEGRAKLYSKIKRAAKAVCGPTGARDAGGLSIASRNRQCYETAMEAAVSQVEAGQLVGLAN